MAGLTRSNGDRVELNTLYTSANLKFFKIDGGSAWTTDSGTPPAALTEGTAGDIARGINPLAHITKSDGDYMIVIVDGTQWDAAGLDAAVTKITDVSTTVTELSTLLSL